MSELVSLTMNAGRLRAIVANPPALIEETEYGCAVTTLGDELSQDDVKPLAAAMVAVRATWDEDQKALLSLTDEAKPLESPHADTGESHPRV